MGLLARLVVGGVWLVAGALKIATPSASINAVQAYRILPSSVAEWVGVALPAVELVIGLALVLGVVVRGAAVLSAVLLVAYIAAIASVWARGIAIDCGCFGGGGIDPDAVSKYPWEIARDAALLIASLLLVRLRRTPLALDALLFPSGSTAVDLSPVEGD